MMNRKEFISSLLVLGVARDEIVRQTQEAFKIEDRETVSNQVGVTLFELRKMGLVAPLQKGTRPSRHSIIKRGLERGMKGSSILRHLKKIHPEISEKIHKQRLCEYRWFQRQGLL